ncbi:hypothetical protein H696_05600 [Fonticula alba]|uniref:Amino acid transporter transmembrane domain-containing protein n=1 Tax=Fonticula alba TaxID=691883 RepID=A0A058Z0T6_FONAL|nr:hypothetical protein H696_05600 [Fonticula alba]KCV67870.1 hypothetical protein H696_05600 [Fonticula alba]|eukprot:XP_009497690.1 hypothetical protein H696_05600 [Fonticula alba]
MSAASDTAPDDQSVTFDTAGLSFASGEARPFGDPTPAGSPGLLASDAGPGLRPSQTEYSSLLDGDVSGSGDASQAGQKFSDVYDFESDLQERLDATSTIFNDENIVPSDSTLRVAEGVARMRFSVFNLVNTIVGGGLLSLLFAMRLLGIVLGPMALAVVCVGSIFSLHLLTECGELALLKSRASYSVLARLALGRIGLLYSDICMILSCFGVATSYLVIFGDTIAPLIASSDPTSGGMSFTTTHRMLVGCALLVVLPLSSLRHLNALRHFSLFAITASLFFIVCVVVRSVQEMVTVGFTDCATTTAGCPEYFNTNPSQMLSAIPLICFAFTCQMNFFSTYGEMKLPNTRRIHKVINRAMIVAISVYLVASVFGYLHFRADILSNILLNYPADDMLLLFGRIAIAIEILLGAPMAVHPLLATLDRLLFPDKEFSWTRRIISLLVVFSLAVTLAMTVADIGFLFGLTGATASTSIAFILPALFYIRLSSNQPLWKGKRLAALVLAVVGVALSIAATVATIMEK